MVVHVSAVVFFGAVLAVLMRQRQVTVGTACVAAAFGFLLASSSAEPAVHDILAAALTALAPVG
ncbi:hypothetical protein [Kitasatospora sp. McL0602]|uniref:hypothetical protein n=1 Tax=Kitasatospora sp. McL0602 TaxID=3439530 RepID=UPI003F890AF8